MGENLISVDLSSLMDTFTTQGDKEAYDYTLDIQDTCIKPSGFPSGLGSMTCLTNSFQTGGIDLTSIYSVDPFPQCDNRDTDFSLQSSIMDGRSNYTIGQAFQTASSSNSGDVFPRPTNLKDEDIKLKPYKTRAIKLLEIDGKARSSGLPFCNDYIY